MEAYEAGGVDAIVPKPHYMPSRPRTPAQQAKHAAVVAVREEHSRVRHSHRRTERATIRFSGEGEAIVGHPVLLVEDHPLVRRAMVRRLATYGPVLAAGSVNEATELLTRFQDFIVALLDFFLPDGTGLDLVEAVRRVRSDLPVLVYTASDDPRVQARVCAAGVRFSPKGELFEHLRPLVHAGAEDERPPRSTAMRALVDSWGLTPYQKHVLETSLRSPSRTEAAATLGISENSLKSGLRSILCKSRHPSMAAVWGALALEAWEKG